LADWTLAPVVEALQALRGMALGAAATIVAELGDISRFSKAEQLMSYLGLVPSEDSSGKRRRQGGITKAGNGATHVARQSGSERATIWIGICDRVVSIMLLLIVAGKR
jgi:transposase